MQLCPRRFNRFITEPQRDHGAHDAALYRGTCGDAVLAVKDGQRLCATKHTFRADPTIAPGSEPRAFDIYRPLRLPPSSSCSYRSR